MTLHLAASHGDLEQIKTFVALGHDVNEENYEGPPLSIAARKGHFDIVRYLIEDCGADINCGKRQIPLFYDAAQGGKLEIVKYLVEQCQVNPNTTGWYGASALHVASWNGHMSIAEYLITECHAEVNRSGENGESPLHNAVVFGHLDVARFLVAHGANVHALSNVNNFETPLHKAADRGQLDVVKYLVEECGVDVHAKTNAGQTALDKAKEIDAWISNGDLKNKAIVAEYLENVMQDQEGGLTMTKSAAFNPAASQEPSS